MSNIIDELKKSNNIVLLCHENPDGDAIGSTLSLYHALTKLGKNVDVVATEVPQKFSFIEGFEKIKNTSDKNYEVAIIVDTSTEERINNPSDIISKVSKIIVIDHHICNTGYGDVNFIDEKPACCQIIYNIIKEMQVEIDPRIGIPLVVGLLTDTGGLSHFDVLPSTYEVAAQLSKIVDIPSIYKKVLGTITKNQFELKKICISNLEFYKEGKICFTYITEEDLNKLGVNKNEADLLANIGRDVEGVEVVIYIRKYNEYNRVSLRSNNNIDVNEVAKKFGCGGHKNAAGIKSTMDFNELKEKLIKEVGKKIDEWNISSK